MSKIKTGGPAFPKTPFIEVGTPQNGMSLRDYFAGKALSGVIADPETSGVANEIQENDDDEVDYFYFCAALAYSYADAMLKVREEQ